MKDKQVKILADIQTKLINDIINVSGMLAATATALEQGHDLREFGNLVAALDDVRLSIVGLREAQLISRLG